MSSSLFSLNDTATTEIYTLSLHDALPILSPGEEQRPGGGGCTRGGRRRAPRRSPRTAPAIPGPRGPARAFPGEADRKSTRLNSSHSQISYAVFCLKKKKKKNENKNRQE